jgi:hypothetical protein
MSGAHETVLSAEGAEHAEAAERNRGTCRKGERLEDCIAEDGRRVGEAEGDGKMERWSDEERGKR